MICPVYTGLFISPSGTSELDCATTKKDTTERSISIGRESLKVFFVLGALAIGPGRPLRFAAHRQPLCWNFMYHSRIVLSVGGSVRYMVRNLRCTVTIDSVLANSKTQNAFLFTVHAIFRHDYPLAVEPASTPRSLVQKKLWEILYLLICSFLPCLSWLLRSRVRNFQRDLWITLY